METLFGGLLKAVRKVMKKRGTYKSPMTAEPALLIVTSSKNEMSILDKFYNHLDHKLIYEKSPQLVGKATIAYSDVRRCLTDKIHRFS